MKKYIPYILIVLVLAIGVAFISTLNGGTLYSKPENSVTQNTSTPTQQIAAIQPQTASIENQKQCATDGENFFNQWLKTNVPHNDKTNSYSYVNPEYHFSTKLNTCLAYVGYIGVNSYLNSDSSHFNIIFNVYSNSPVLESDTYRTCNGADPCTEKTMPGNDGNQTLGTTDFFNQKGILFSQ